VTSACQTIAIMQNLEGGPIANRTGRRVGTAHPTSYGYKLDDLAKAIEGKRRCSKIKIRDSAVIRIENGGKTIPYAEGLAD
jgi:hypothetical protein